MTEESLAMEPVLPRRRASMAGIVETRRLNAILGPHRDVLGELQGRIALLRARATPEDSSAALDALEAAQLAFEDAARGMPDPWGIATDLRRSYAQAKAMLASIL